MNLIKKTAFATALAATALTSATPAMARDHWHRGGDRTGAAIAVGVVGLALGAMIASSANDRHRYRDRYYRDGRYYDRDGRYYDDRYDRYDRYDRDYYDRRGYRGW